MREKFGQFRFLRRQEPRPRATLASGELIAHVMRPALTALGFLNPYRKVRKVLEMARTKFLVLQSSKMVQRPLGLADPALPPASVVNSTTSTTPTMEDLLIGGVGHRQVLDPLGSAPS